MAMALIAATINGQAPERPYCITDEMYHQSIRENPQYLKNHLELEDFTKKYVEQNQARMRTAQSVNTINTPPTYVIPVVFHVLHEYGAENISDAQILDCLQHMNEDYRKLNADTSNTLAIFKPIAADCGIEFRLATIDPNGNCTNGIDRIYTSKTNSANNDSKLNPWTGNYLNIWTAKTLENTGAAAYSHFPGTVALNKEGVMSRYDYIGTIGAGGPGGLHTISHEVGHFLNLAHTWGTTNSPGVACGDDFVQDTPETQGWTSCNLSAAVCNPPVIENVQNFMEYSYCDNMFTVGQKTRMYAALSSSLGSRNTLWTASNLIATGTNSTNPVSQCAPIADFWTTQQSVCVGRTVNFRDYSWNAHPTSWSWSFPGGTPSTSTDSLPAVVYNSPGIYDVTLVVSNANGSNTLTRTAFIRVSGSPSIQGLFTEPFTTAAALTANDAWIYNPDAGSTTWTFFPNAGANSTPTSLKLNNYSNTAGQIDEWISPGFDISNLTGATMKFYVANAQRNSTSNDLLRVFSSSNCGENWTNKYSKSGSSLATAGVVGVNFTPSSTQWRQETVSLNGIFPRTNIRFKFQNTSDRGNNTYIDELQITGTPSNVDEVDEVTTGFGLFPNPSNGVSTVQFKLNSSQRVRIYVHDITGRMIQQVLDETLSADMHDVKVSIDTPGIYLVDVLVGEKHHVRRLTIAE